MCIDLEWLKESVLTKYLTEVKMEYQGSNFTFNFAPNSNQMYYEQQRVRLFIPYSGEQCYEYGIAYFENDNDAYHTTLVPVPQNLSDFDIDTSYATGPQLFENGEIIYDPTEETLIYPKYARSNGDYLGFADGVNNQCFESFEIEDGTMVYAFSR